MSRINIIAAIDSNRAIGYRNKLLFHIDEDMKRFKQLTMGHAIVMGRNTFMSLPNGALPARRNIVVSTSLHEAKNVEVYSNLNDALAACANEEDIYIIGGEKIYRQTIDIADRMYLTEIDEMAPNADAWFPNYDGWKIKEETLRQGYSFKVYDRL